MRKPNCVPHALLVLAIAGCEAMPSPWTESPVTEPTPRAVDLDRVRVRGTRQSERVATKARVEIRRRSRRLQPDEDGAGEREAGRWTDPGWTDPAAPARPSSSAPDSDSSNAEIRTAPPTPPLSAPTWKGREKAR